MGEVSVKYRVPLRLESFQMDLWKRDLTITNKGNSLQSRPRIWKERGDIVYGQNERNLAKVR